MRNKLYELKNEVQREISTAHLAPFPEEITSFTDIFDYLTAITADEDLSNVVAPKRKHVETIINVLDKWPAIHRFPLLDLVRLIAAYCPQPLNDASLHPQFLQALLRASDWDEDWTPPISKAKERNMLLLFRATANAFQENVRVGDSPWALDIFNKLCNSLSELFTPAQRVVSATIMLNFSCITLREPCEPTLRSTHLKAVISSIILQPNDNETTYRATIALGNVAYAARQFNQPLSTEEIVKVRDTIEFVQKSSYTKPGQSAADAAVDKARSTSVGKEILSML